MVDLPDNDFIGELAMEQNRNRTDKKPDLADQELESKNCFVGPR
jgi:hypothetical protein